MRNRIQLGAGGCGQRVERLQCSVHHSVDEYSHGGMGSMYSSSQGGMRKGMLRVRSTGSQTAVFCALQCTDLLCMVLIPMHDASRRGVRAGKAYSAGGRWPRGTRGPGRGSRRACSPGRPSRPRTPGPATRAPAHPPRTRRCCGAALCSWAGPPGPAQQAAGVHVFLGKAPRKRPDARPRELTLHVPVHTAALQACCVDRRLSWQLWH